MQVTVVGLCLPLLLVVELELVGLEGSAMVGKSVSCFFVKRSRVKTGQPWLSCQRVASFIWPLAGFLWVPTFRRSVLLVLVLPTWILSYIEQAFRASWWEKKNLKPWEVTLADRQIK